MTISSKVSLVGGPSLMRIRADPLLAYTQLS